MTKKSERAELEEALAYIDKGRPWNMHILRMEQAARKHLATLPPDPVKAPELYAITNETGNRYGTTADRAVAEHDLEWCRRTYTDRTWRIVRYVPQEE